MEQFNQAMSRAAVQEADRLAKKLVAAAAKIKEVDEEADCLFDSREELVDEKRKRDLHIRLLKGHYLFTWRESDPYLSVRRRLHECRQ